SQPAPSPTSTAPRQPAAPPREAPPSPAPTSEHSRPGVRPPVSGDTARLVVTIYETEDTLADEHRLRAVASMLKEHPGNDEVRLVIHDGEGHDSEFDLPRAAVNEDLARSIRNILQKNGQVRLTGTRDRAA
ncbi:MAG: hypothetical protein ACKVVT_15405, partial [Dehalococcoidia bacterium]